MADYDDPVLQALGRVEGKLDAFTRTLTGHDDDIDELRREVNRTNERVATVATTLKVLSWLIGVVIIPVLGIVAGVVAMYRGGA